MYHNQIQMMQMKIYYNKMIKNQMMKYYKALIILFNIFQILKIYNLSLQLKIHDFMLMLQQVIHLQDALASQSYLIMCVIFEMFIGSSEFQFYQCLQDQLPAILRHQKRQMEESVHVNGSMMVLEHKYMLINKKHKFSVDHKKSCPKDFQK